jgi:hypothetical protein
MLRVFNQNYQKILKKLPLHSNKNVLKIGLFIGLSAYWGIILVGTFLQVN